MNRFFGILLGKVGRRPARNARASKCDISGCEMSVFELGAIFLFPHKPHVVDWAAHSLCVCVNNRTLFCLHSSTGNESRDSCESRVVCKLCLPVFALSSETWRFPSIHSTAPFICSVIFSRPLQSCLAQPSTTAPSFSSPSRFTLRLTPTMDPSECYETDQKVSAFKKDTIEKAEHIIHKEFPAQIEALNELLTVSARSRQPQIQSNAMHFISIFFFSTHTCTEWKVWPAECRASTCGQRNSDSVHFQRYVCRQWWCWWRQAKAYEQFIQYGWFGDRKLWIQCGNFEGRIQSVGTSVRQCTDQHVSSWSDWRTQATNSSTDRTCDHGKSQSVDRFIDWIGLNIGFSFLSLSLSLFARLI